MMKQLLTDVINASLGGAQIVASEDLRYCALNINIFWIFRHFKMNFFEFSAISGDHSRTLTFLREKGLLKRGKFCNDCGIWATHLKDTSRKNDKFCWRCCRCRKKWSIREGSFFESSKLPLNVLLSVIYFFILDVPQKTILTLLQGTISEKSLIDWANFCRDIFSRNLLRFPVLLGQNGDIVEIDEAKFGTKRKYNRGRFRGEGQWIFGAIGRDSKKVLIFTVENRQRDTIQPIIQRHIIPGATIYSDCYVVYDNLAAIGYHHQSVNHTETFVNPVDGTHTNSIEGFWAHAKNHFKRMYGTKSEMFASHLDEIMYRWNNKHRDLFAAFIEDISIEYNTTEVAPNNVPPPPIQM